MHSKHWPPIYPDITKSPSSRIQCYIPLSDHRLLVGTAGTNTILSFVLQQSIKLTADYVRQRKLSILDADEFIEYLRERTFTSPAPKTPAPTLAGRDSDVRERATDVSNVATESGETASSGRSDPEGKGRRTSRASTAKKR